MKSNIKYSLVLMLMIGICAFFIYGFTHDGIKKQKTNICGSLKTSEKGIMYYTHPEIMPVFSGNIEQTIQQHLVYPKGICVTGNVYVSFIVDQNGKIIEKKILRGISKSTDENALQVLDYLDSWMPGKCNKEKVATEIRLAISFDLH